MLDPFGCTATMRMIVINHHMLCTTCHMGKAKVTCRLPCLMGLDCHTLLVKSNVASFFGGQNGQINNHKCHFGHATLSH
jgi:hypothetical protein